MKKVDLLIVCSPGGHFREAKSLIEGLEGVKFCFAMHLPSPDNQKDMGDLLVTVPHAERDIRIVLQYIYALYVIMRTRPKVILSTGAMIGVTFGFIGKFFGCKFIFVESPTRVENLSLSGRICYYLADTFYVRYKTLKIKYEKAIYCE